MCFIAIVIELVHLPDIAIIKIGHLVLAILQSSVHGYLCILFLPFTMHMTFI